MLAAQPDLSCWLGERKSGLAWEVRGSRTVKGHAAGVTVKALEQFTTSLRDALPRSACGLRTRLARGQRSSSMRLSAGSSNGKASVSDSSISAAQNRVACQLAEPGVQSALKDSNLRPLAPKASALTKLR